jgi:hypothetical protein
MPDSNYEIFALRYATSENRSNHQNFLLVDNHDTPASPLDFYIFVIRSTDRLFVVDTGFDPESGRRKGRDLLRGCVHEYWPTCADEFWPTLWCVTC